MKKFLIITYFLLLLPQHALASRVSPVDNGTVTSGIGWRIDPFGSGRMVYHSGYDIAVPVGTPVHPTQKGTVYFAGPWKGYGNLVVIEHGEGYVTLYGHNGDILVKAGDKVDTGTVIALSGNTGHSTGPHVHYEIRQLPGSAKAERDRLEKSVKAYVENNLDRIVTDYANGKGGGDVDSVMPDDLNE